VATALTVTALPRYSPCHSTALSYCARTHVSHMISHAQVHDELIFEVPTPLLAAAARCVKQCMETIQIAHAARFELPPLPVSLFAGESWGAMQPLPDEGGGAEVRGDTRWA
jgi:hypothetical protein